VFDAVYRTRSVSRAAESLGLSQPAASQGLTRLRLQLRDALFVRAPGGVRPTPRADRLALAVQSAITTLEAAFNESERFDPRQSQMSLRLSSSHFLALPAIVRSTDLAVVMPRAIAQGFINTAAGGFALAEPRLPHSDFTVSLHWSRRFEADPAHRWMRQLLLALFKDRPARPDRSSHRTAPAPRARAAAA
jgi:DNA-binding transcriptional LysR family regulator